MRQDETGNAISELWAGRAIKIVCVVVNNDRGALLSNWGQTVKHRSENLFRKMQTETYTIWREDNGVLKPKQGSVCNEAVNALRKMLPARRLKGVSVDLAWDPVATQPKLPWMINEPICSTEHLMCYPPCQ